jgi:hypothetical protein
MTGAFKGGKMAVKCKVQDNDNIEIVVVTNNSRSATYFTRNDGESDTDFVARALAGGASLDTNVSDLETEIGNQGGTLY